MFVSFIGTTDSLSSTYFYTISANDDGIDLWSDIVADNGGSTPSQNNIQVTIESGVEIGAVDNTSGTNYAIDVTDDFATNSKTLTIINNGYVGGFGGDGAEYDVSVPGNGGNGGTAINFNSNATLINNGTLAGGGGGGGGNTTTESEPGGYTFYSDGGGGAGLPAGSAGGGYTPGPLAEGASNGTRDSGGFATFGIEDSGGNGGNPGIAGQNSGASGGAAGYPYQENSGISVTFTNNGTMYGSPLLS